MHGLASIRLRGFQVCCDSGGRPGHVWSCVLGRTSDRYVMEAPRRWVRFEEPDEAYLAAAALRRYRDGSVDAILIPTDRGPAIDIASDALRDPLVRSLVWRFGGRLDDAPADVEHETAAVTGGPQARSPDASPGASQRLRSSLM
jgi:hypothetical protein